MSSVGGVGSPDFVRRKPVAVTADDSPTQRRLSAKTLDSLGFETCTVSNAEDAVKALHRESFYDCRTERIKDPVEPRVVIWDNQFFPRRDSEEPVDDLGVETARSLSMEEKVRGLRCKFIGHTTDPERMEGAKNARGEDVFVAVVRKGSIEELKRVLSGLNLAPPEKDPSDVEDALLRMDAAETARFGQVEAFTRQIAAMNLRSAGGDSDDDLG